MAPSITCTFRCVHDVLPQCFEYVHWRQQFSGCICCTAWLNPRVDVAEVLLLHVIACSAVCSQAILGTAVLWLLCQIVQCSVLLLACFAYPSEVQVALPLFDIAIDCQSQVQSQSASTLHVLVQGHQRCLGAGLLPASSVCSGACTYCASAWLLRQPPFQGCAGQPAGRVSCSGLGF